MTYLYLLLGRIGRGPSPPLTYKKNAFVHIIHSADEEQSQRGTEKLMVDTTVLLVFLWKHNKMRQIH